MKAKIWRDANSLKLRRRFHESQMSVRSVFMGGSDDRESARSVHMSVTLRASTNVFLQYAILEHNTFLIPLIIRFS